MKRKGYDFKPAQHLTFRGSRPEDVSMYLGKFGTDHVSRRPGGGAYLVIVSKTQIEKTMRAQFGATPANHWRAYRQATEIAPCLPFSGHSRTNMIYGTWRKRNGGRWFNVRTKPSLNPAQYKEAERAGEENPEGWEEKWFDVHWTRPIYWVEKMQVYTATTYTHQNPKEEE